MADDPGRIRGPPESPWETGAEQERCHAWVQAAGHEAQAAWQRWAPHQVACSSWHGAAITALLGAYLAGVLAAIQHARAQHARLQLPAAIEGTAAGVRNVRHRHVLQAVRQVQSAFRCGAKANGHDRSAISPGRGGERGGEGESRLGGGRIEQDDCAAWDTGSRD